MASRAYNTGWKKLTDGTFTWTGSTIKLALMKSSYSQDPDSDTMADIAADEISVSGYARQTLGTKTFTQDDANDRTNYGAANAVFAGLAAGQTVGGAVAFYDPGTGDANTVLIAFLDLTDTATNGGSITVQFASTGVVYAQI